MKRAFVVFDSKEMLAHHPEIYQKLHDLFLNEESFPCLFATSSFKKLDMFFAVEKSSDNRSVFVSSVANSIAVFKEIFLKNFQDGSKKYNTLLLLFPSIELEKNHKSIQDFVINLLIDLNSTDSESSKQLCENDFFNPDFEFYFLGMTWFPVFLCQDHITDIRKAPFSMLALQPSALFDSLKRKPEFYEKMRSSIHERIDCYYRHNLPVHLTSESSGINIIQYLGFDPKYCRKID